MQLPNFWFSELITVKRASANCPANPSSKFVVSKHCTISGWASPLWEVNFCWYFLNFIGTLFLYLSILLFFTFCSILWVVFNLKSKDYMRLYLSLSLKKKKMKFAFLYVFSPCCFSIICQHKQEKLLIWFLMSILSQGRAWQFYIAASLSLSLFLKHEWWKCENWGETWKQKRTEKLNRLFMWLITQNYSRRSFLSGNLDNGSIQLMVLFHKGFMVVH